MTAREEIDHSGVVSNLRVPPHSVEAEQSVIGGLLNTPEAWDKVGDLLAATDFYLHIHRTIFGVIGAMATADKPVDVIAVNDQLRDLGKEQEVGGLVYLDACAQSVPSAGMIRYYATIVREKALRRKIIAVVDRAGALAWHTELPVTEVLDQVSSLVHGLEKGQVRKMPRPFDQLLVERLDRITDLSTGQLESGWPTHFPTLDNMLKGGLRAGGVYVLAARPSIGKSAFAAALGLGFAHDGLPTLFLSQEMGDGEVADRALANLGEISYGNLQTGKLNDIEWSQLSTSIETARNLPFYVDDEESLTMAEIRSKARSVKGLKVLILDYLQLTDSKGSHANRNGEIEEVSRGMKAMAKEMGIAVLMLSQLNRKVEERPGKRPMLSDLRDSGSIEQDADVVMFLWPLKEFKSDGFWAIGCDIPKNRQGKKGAFALHFWGDYMRWAESAFRLEDLISRDKASASTGGGFD